MVIGGTSAGMAIQGKFYFSAEVGSATSAQALGNPYHPNVTVDSISFIKNDYLEDVITDTHYDNPDRKGRYVAFMARIIEDYATDAKGIACDEYTAVCIGTDGIAHVYGDHPTYDDNVYFIRTNCLLADKNPENCTDGNPLNWNRGGEALKVYAVKGTTTGNNTFDLNNWETGVGGEWQHWYVNSGTLVEGAGTPPNCAWVSNDEKNFNITNVFPNPSQTGLFYVNSEILISQIWVMDINGKVIIQKENINQNTFEIDLGDFSDGIYFIQIIDENNVMNNQKLIKG